MVTIVPLTRPPLGHLGFSDEGEHRSILSFSRYRVIRPAWPGAQSLHSLGSARPTRAALPGPAAPPLKRASRQAAAARSLRREQQKREPQQAAPNNKSSLCRLRWPHPSALGWWTRTRGARSKNNTMIPAHLAGCRYARYPSFAVEMIPPRRKVFSSRSAGLRCLSSCQGHPLACTPSGLRHLRAMHSVHLAPLRSQFSVYCFAVPAGSPEGSYPLGKTGKIIWVGLFVA